jgi:hypothetical protein
MQVKNSLGTLQRNDIAFFLEVVKKESFLIIKKKRKFFFQLIFFSVLTIQEKTKKNFLF